MPIPSLNLGHCFDAGARPDAVAIIDLREERRPIECTFGQLDAECEAVACGLRGAGLRRGERVGVLSQNRFEMLAAMFGAMRAGLVAVPISFKLPREIIGHIIRDAGLVALFHDREREGLCPPGVRRIGFDDPSGYAASKGTGRFETVRPEPREVGMMLYTSGSTGRPKGVLLSHDAQRWPLEQVLASGDDPSHHRFLVAAPLFHMNATFSVARALATGASVVLLPTFGAQSYARAIERHRVTWLTSVPTMLALVAREHARGGAFDFSSVERVMMGSAPLTQALVDKVEALFPGARVENGYGTTEAGPLPFGDHPEGIPRPPLSVGHPTAGSEVALREGPSVDEGVLYMRGPMLMNGYHDMPSLTAEALRDGWYRSGDIMRRDEDGFYYFVGRVDDMFVVGGENVWPGEVERLLERMPGVHQALVVPVPDEIKGALPFAFVVPAPGAAVDEAAVKAFAIANGPAFAHPRFVEVASHIPLSATNKPDRRLLAREAEAIARRRRPTPPEISHASPRPS
jgi:acyl-CoA synthetase (AMP-forming)/AMP-acid ligase II